MLQFVFDAFQDKSASIGVLGFELHMGRQGRNVGADGPDASCNLGCQCYGGQCYGKNQALRYVLIKI